MRDSKKMGAKQRRALKEEMETLPSLTINLLQWS